MGSKDSKTVKHYGDEPPYEEDPGVIWIWCAVYGKYHDATDHHRHPGENHHSWQNSRHLVDHLVLVEVVQPHVENVRSFFSPVGMWRTSFTGYGFGLTGTPSSAPGKVVKYGKVWFIALLLAVLIGME